MEGCAAAERRILEAAAEIHATFLSFQEGHEALVRGGVVVERKTGVPARAAWG